jgi:hypothetical protein
VSDVAENAAKKVMIGKGRKKGIKRAALAKTPIRGPTKKHKTSLDNYSKEWNDELVLDFIEKWYKHWF